jgi:hypothetical protein
MCQQAQLLRRYLIHIHICMRVYLCALFKISECCIYDRQGPSTILLLQHKICIDLFLLFLKSFSSAWCNSFFWIDRLFCSFLPFLFFDFIEHERVEVMMSFFEQTLSKKKRTQRMNYISYAFCWIIILRVFIESFITSRDLHFSFFWRLFFFLLLWCLRTVTAGLCIRI